jgi:hypothetical protein
VVPRLWRGGYAPSEASIQDRLMTWIEDIPDQAVIVTDCPDIDFFGQLVPLLPIWPKNLHKYPMQFSTWSMGDERQPVLQKLLDDYHSTKRPKHHALHDAHSLRLCMRYALQEGWKPFQEN